MNCERIIKRYLNQDNPDRLALLVRLHLMTCPRCQAEIRMLQKEFARLRDTDMFQPPYDITETVMARISKFDMILPQTVFSLQWLLAGLVIISSIALISFSETLDQMQTFFGSDLDFPLHLILGLLITSYAMITAGVHLSRLKNLFSGRLWKHRIW